MNYGSFLAGLKATDSPRVFDPSANEPDGRGGDDDAAGSDDETLGGLIYAVQSAPVLVRGTLPFSSVSFRGMYYLHKK